MAFPQQIGFHKLGSRNPVDYDVLSHFQRKKPSLGNLKDKSGLQPELLQAFADMNGVPERVRNRLWRLEAERQCSSDASAHDLIEFEQFKLLDYWKQYGMGIGSPPEVCDKDYIEELQSSLLRLCLQLNRYGFRGSDAALFTSHYAQIDTIVAAIKRFRQNPSLFPDQPSKDRFWRIVLKCQIYLKETKSASYLERVHRSSSQCVPSVASQSNTDGLNEPSHQGHASKQAEAPKTSEKRMLWHEFLHRNAPIAKKGPPAQMFAYTQIVPPGGQKILEWWDWEYQNERVDITDGPWDWKYGYAGLATKKVEKTLFGGNRLVELVSDTENLELQKLKDIEGRLVGDWEKRHELETFTFCTRNWLEEDNPADAVLNDFLHVHKINDG